MSAASWNPAAQVGPQTSKSTFETVYRFNFDGGRVPVGGLLDENGTFYGSTNFGGNLSKDCFPGRGCGTVYSVTASGKAATLYKFKTKKSGLRPYAGLVDVNGTLYGTTQDGGAYSDGTVFALQKSGAESVILAFDGKNGNDPRAALTNVNGVLYGTTYLGGAAGAGTVFSLTMSGSKYVETILHSFAGGKDGALPLDALLGVNGVLYGTTSAGGASNDGTIFEIDAQGKERLLYSFKGGTSDGAQPFAALIDFNGTLYGTTTAGGAENKGIVFAFKAKGSERVLHSFGSGSDGSVPNAGLTVSNGQLYGNTRFGGSDNDGTIYTITPAGKEQVLYSFTGGYGGFAPYASLVAANGTLYGTTLFGGLGTGYGDGTFFAFTPGS